MTRRVAPTKPHHHPHQIRMVEGHQCHRVVASHRQLLVGRAFDATSPNGRLADGARAVHRRVLRSADAHGKQLFYRFGGGASSPEKENVIAIHFGMSGKFCVTRAPSRDALPPPTPTTRLRLVAEDEAAGGVLCADLSAMTVLHGGPELEASRRSTLGADPLRSDADVDAAFAKLHNSHARRSIGFALMDQAVVAGVGNIYRAEILAAARVHPDTPCAAIDRPTWDVIWGHAVTQMQTGFETGSIVTANRAGLTQCEANPTARRLVYNSVRCAHCNGRVVSWQINARTAYACVACQPLRSGHVATAVKPSTVFASACAPPTAAETAANPETLKVAALKKLLQAAGAPTGGGKAVLVARVRALGAPKAGTEGLKPASAAAAAAEKAAVGEKRNVEHVPQGAEDATVGVPVTPSPAKAKRRVTKAGK